MTCALPTAETGKAQERMDSPLMCTVQAPHWPIPQPYFEPVRPRWSRKIQSKGVSAAASTLYFVPLTLSVNSAMSDRLVVYSILGKSREVEELRS